MAEKPIKTLLFLGLEGTGKTTEIVSIVNYITGVEYDSDFRFMLKESDSEITEHIFHWQPGSKVDYTLVLVDTPGFKFHVTDSPINHSRNAAIERALETYFLTTRRSFTLILYFLRFDEGSVDPEKMDVLNIFSKDVERAIVINMTFSQLAGAWCPANKVAKKIPHQDSFAFANHSFITYKDPSKTYWDPNYAEYKRLFNYLREAKDVDFTEMLLLLEKRKSFMQLQKDLELEFDFFAVLEERKEILLLPAHYHAFVEKAKKGVSLYRELTTKFIRTNVVSVADHLTTRMAKQSKEKQDYLKRLLKEVEK